MNPIVSAIISSIIDSILESAMTPAPVVPPGAPPGVVRPALQNGPLAMMGPPSNGQAQFGNETLRLSASLQIRDTQNRIVMSGSLQQPVPVLYKIDELSLIHI